MTIEPGNGNVVKKAPSAVLLICGTVVVVAIIGAGTALSLYGKDTEALIRVINTLMNALGILTGTGALLYAGAAAKSSAKVEEKTSNGELDARIEDAVKIALQQYGVTSVEGGDAHGRQVL